MTNTDGDSRTSNRVNNLEIQISSAMCFDKAFTTNYCREDISKNCIPCEKPKFQRFKKKVAVFLIMVCFAYLAYVFFPTMISVNILSIVLKNSEHLMSMDLNERVLHFLISFQVYNPNIYSIDIKKIDYTMSVHTPSGLVKVGSGNLEETNFLGYEISTAKTNFAVPLFIEDDQISPIVSICKNKSSMLSIQWSLLINIRPFDKIGPFPVIIFDSDLNCHTLTARFNE